MTIMIRTLLFAIVLTRSWQTSAQSEIIVSYNEEPIDLKEGITLSEITYPLVKLELVQDDEIRNRYPNIELTLVRKGRAVFSIRRSEMDDGRKVSLRYLLQRARAGDNIVVSLKKDLDSNSGKVISFPIK